MTAFDTALYGGIGFFAIMGTIMLCVNLKMRRELNKPYNKKQKGKDVS